MDFITELEHTFLSHTNNSNAEQMAAYMLNKFDFYGIKAPLRRSLSKPIIEKYKFEIRDTIRTISFDIYDLSQREMHMIAIELFEKELRKSYKKEDITLIEKLITTNSWWDTVDFIAKQILGKYLIIYKENIPSVISKFSNSKNMWLQRSSIIFQLGYKEKTDKELLFQQCLLHKESDEFFIKKAIGWALREYGKVNPTAVLDFVESNELKPLSKREAIRRLV